MLKKIMGCVCNHFSTKAVRVLARNKVIVDIRLVRDVSTLRGPVGVLHRQYCESKLKA